MTSRNYEDVRSDHTNWLLGEANRFLAGVAAGTIEVPRRQTDTTSPPPCSTLQDINWLCEQTFVKAEVKWSASPDQGSVEADQKLLRDTMVLTWTFADFRRYHDRWLLNLARKSPLWVSSNGTPVRLADRSENDAISIVERAWINAEKDWPNNLEKGKVGKEINWLTTILIRIWIEVLRRQGSLEALSLDAPVDPTEEGGVALVDKQVDPGALVPGTDAHLAQLDMSATLEHFFMGARIGMGYSVEVAMFLDYYADTWEVDGHNYKAAVPILIRAGAKAKDGSMRLLTPSEKIQILAATLVPLDPQNAIVVKQTLAGVEKGVRDRLSRFLNVADRELRDRDVAFRDDVDRAVDATQEQLQPPKPPVTRRDLLMFSTYYSDANRPFELTISEICAREGVSVGAGFTNAIDRVKTRFCPAFTDLYDDLYERLYRYLSEHPSLTDLTRRETLLLECMDYTAKSKKILAEFLKADPTFLKYRTRAQLLEHIMRLEAEKHRQKQGKTNQVDASASEEEN